MALLVFVEWLLPGPGADWFRHSPWHGIRVADVVFPAFLFMVGASASVAAWRGWGRVARRFLVLVVVGLLFNAWGTSGADLAGLRFTGVLPMIAVAGLLATALVRLTDRPLVVGAAAFGVLGAHGLVLSHWPLGCGTGRLDPGCSAAWRLDLAVFDPAHLYRAGAAGHDPEGLLTTVLGATALVLLGWTAARLLYRSSDGFLATALLAVAALGGAGATATVWPPTKRLWTPTFGLLLAAGCILVLLALARALDDRPHRRLQPLRWTLTALGRNALLVYVGQHVVLTALTSTPASGGDGTLATALLDRAGSLWAVAALAVVGWAALAAALHGLRWYWTV